MLSGHIQGPPAGNARADAPPAAVLENPGLSRVTPAPSAWPLGLGKEPNCIPPSVEDELEELAQSFFDRSAHSNT